MNTYDTYIHANQKGTGSAVKFALHPANGEIPGAVLCEIAMQSTIGNIRGGVFPTFDWVNKIVVKFDRADLVQVLKVLKGRQETIADGHGLFHRTARANTIIRFFRQTDPREGYVLSISRKNAEGELRNAWFVFDPDEAFALMLALEQAMLYVCFGIPQICERKREIPQIAPAAAEEKKMPLVRGDVY